MRGYSNVFQNDEMKHAYGRALDRGDTRLAENMRRLHPDLSEKFDREDRERNASAEKIEKE